MNVLELSEQEIGRRESLQQLREMGINPYPAAEYPTNAFSTEIVENFQDEAEPRQVSIAAIYSDLNSFFVFLVFSLRFKSPVGIIFLEILCFL